MWILVVASCFAGDPVPDCGSGISPVHYAGFEACEAAAIRYHDHIRAIAEDAELTVLLLDTRCRPLTWGNPA